MSKATMANPKFCMFEGCGRKHYGNNLCRGHYQQRKRGTTLHPLGEPRTFGPRKAKTACAFGGCDKPSRTGGLCSGHHNQKTRGQELRPLRARRANGIEVQCAFPDCGNNTNGGAHGLCRGHNRQRSLGRELEPLTDFNDSRARDDQGRKQCSGCRTWLPVERFHGDAARADGLNGKCSSCVRSSMLLNTYGVTLEAYDDMLSSQGDGCAICGVCESPDGSSLAVDHDHACCPGPKSCGDCVRGLLCRPCNQGLGNYADSVDRLRAAIAYLTR